MQFISQEKEKWEVWKILGKDVSENLFLLFEVIARKYVTYVGT